MQNMQHLFDGQPVIMQKIANFKAQTTLKEVKCKLNAGFLRSDVCFPSSATGENIEKSFGSPDNQPDEATIFLDAMSINLL